MTTRITKTWTFDAAHMLPNHDGKCARLHGHTYKVEVSVSGPVKTGDVPDEGMVIDFYVLSQIWKEHLEPKLDHRYLNDSLPANAQPTTAENIAGWIGGQFAGLLPGGVLLDRVRVWETPTGYAEVTRW